MFKVTRGKGVRITFASGWTISIQWGPGNYCDNHHAPLESPHGSDGSRSAIDAQAIRVGEAGSATAEIAIWDECGDWLDFGSDTVLGWQTPDEVAYWIGVCASGKLPAGKGLAWRMPARRVGSK
jgi:hypothetical protein